MALPCDESQPTKLELATTLLSQALDAIPDYDRNMKLITEIEVFLGIDADEADLEHTLPLQMQARRLGAAQQEGEG